MRKKTTPKKTRSKKNIPKKKKQVSIKRRKEETLLTKVKNMVGGTAAKIRETFLPAGEDTAKEPDQRKSEIPRT
jgi:hypothetical protein